MKGEAICPECGKRGSPVQKATVESLVKQPSFAREEPTRFCATADCPVVYYSEMNHSVFHKLDLKVRVGIKEKEDPIPVCYCFGWDRKRIWEEIRETGKSTAAESITREVKAGRCFCERSNPQGTCCLGNVSQRVREGMNLYGSKGGFSDGKPTAS